MQPFYWNRNFEIGIASVDQQHHMLVDLVNNLAEAAAGGAHLPEVRKLTAALMDYAVQHFTEEEELLDRSPLPEADKVAHLAAHRAFVERVQGLTSREDLLQPEIIQAVFDFLTTWLVSHILRLDRKLAQSLQLVPDEEPRPGGLEVSPVERILLGALTETERRFRLLSDHTPSLIWVSDSHGERSYFNRAWTELLGLAMEALDEGWPAALHPDERQAYLELLAALHRNPQPAQAEFRLRDAKGQERWYFEKILPRRTEDGTFLGLIASATDVTSLKQAELLLSRANEDLEREVARRTAQLEQLMLTDPLTGVGNRRHLMTQLEAEVERARRYGRLLSVLFVDIDHFKRVNDTCGHATGDQVLVAVATHLRAQLRTADALGRYGGEEFIAILPDTDRDSAARAAERWLAGLPELAVPGLDWPVTASAGVAQWQPSESAEALLARCDQALYQAKADGRACVRLG